MLYSLSYHIILILDVFNYWKCIIIHHNFTIWTFSKNASFYWIFYFVTIKFISQLHTTNIYSLIDRLSLVPSCATEAMSMSTTILIHIILVFSKVQLTSRIWDLISLSSTVFTVPRSISVKCCGQCTDSNIIRWR
jgi:hypothetical protein